MSILPEEDRVKVNVINVYDGDTITVDIPNYPDIIGKRIGVRIAGIDTPEIRTKDLEEKKLGVKAKEAVQAMVDDASVVYLRNIRRDKYFRILADVYVDSINVGDTLVEKGLAVIYHGGTKKPWFNRS